MYLFTDWEHFNPSVQNNLIQTVSSAFQCGFLQNVQNCPNTITKIVQESEFISWNTSLLEMCNYNFQELLQTLKNHRSIYISHPLCAVISIYPNFSTATWLKQTPQQLTRTYRHTTFTKFDFNILWADQYCGASLTQTLNNFLLYEDRAK